MPKMSQADAQELLRQNTYLRDKIKRMRANPPEIPFIACDNSCVIANPRGSFFLTRDAENVGRWFAAHGLIGVYPEPGDLGALLRREALVDP